MANGRQVCNDTSHINMANGSQVRTRKHRYNQIHFSGSSVSPSEFKHMDTETGSIFVLKTIPIPYVE